MSDADRLLQLAEAYASTFRQLAEIRRSMLEHLSNGSDPAPPSSAPGPTKPPHKGASKGTGRAAVMLKAGEADAALIEALKISGPTTHAQLVKLVEGKPTTTSARLKRLSERGLVQRSAEGLWAISNP
jgi:hypothetical protein